MVVLVGCDPKKGVTEPPDLPEGCERAIASIPPNDRLSSKSGATALLVLNAEATEYPDLSFFG